MRTEIALIIAETIGVIVGASLTSLDDGRAQYGTALVLASLPAFYFVISILFLPNFWLLQKFQRHSHKNYLLLGIIWAAALALPISSLGGVIAGFSLGAAIMITFISFSLLSNVQTSA